MAHPLYEIEEEILKRLNVRDLIRFKSVCKSWSSLLSNPHFIKAHLNHHCDNDRDSGRIGHRRITMSKKSDHLSCRHYEIDHNFFDLNDLHLLGSSNGLVCVSPSLTEILVVNPSTREVRKVTKPQIPEKDSLCWGFGYESSTDDYKLVLGFKRDENHTSFQVFSLRSNIWKVIGEINYVFTTRVAILCKGTLHWLAYDTSSEKKNVIISFHFSDEKFVEVPTPDVVRYLQLGKPKLGQPLLMRLGTINERLCLIRHIFHHEVWVMNKEQSWELLEWEGVINDDAVHNIKLLKKYIPNKPFCYQRRPHDYWLCNNTLFLGTPIYVESLVSPHFHVKPPRKRLATSTIKSPKVKANRGAEPLHAIPNACEDASTSSGVRI